MFPPEKDIAGSLGSVAGPGHLPRARSWIVGGSLLLLVLGIRWYWVCASDLLVVFPKLVIEPRITSPTKAQHQGAASFQAPSVATAIAALCIEPFHPNGC